MFCLHPMRLLNFAQGSFFWPDEPDDWSRDQRRYFRSRIESSCGGRKVNRHVVEATGRRARRVARARQPIEAQMRAVPSDDCPRVDGP
jgi:hypothetical protein